MKVTANMALNQLAKRMGDTATRAEAEAMRDLLINAGHEGRDTTEVAESEWCQHLCHAVELARLEKAEVSYAEASDKLSESAQELMAILVELIETPSEVSHATLSAACQSVCDSVLAADSAWEALAAMPCTTAELVKGE